MCCRKDSCSVVRPNLPPAAASCMSARLLASSAPHPAATDRCMHLPSCAAFHCCVAQASWTSAVAFSMGAGLPLLAGAFIGDWRMRIISVVLVSAAALVLFGGLGASLGGAKVSKGALRVLIGGLIAMGVTYAIGAAFAAVAGPSFKMAA